MPDFAEWSLAANLGVFAAAAAVIGVTGVLLARTAEVLAARTGLGQAVMGAVFLGGTTSLPGSVLSVNAAATEHPELAISHAVGGIAVQTAFLGLADIAYRNVNLEHAAASVGNLIQGALLVALLALPVLAATAPSVTVSEVHPISAALLGAYGAGLWVMGRSREEPMWRPVLTAQTVQEEEQQPEGEPSLGVLWLRFGLLAAVVGAAGYVVSQASVALTEITGVSETAVGAIPAAVTTSLPELVTVIAAVRMGALTLAVGDILGGNAFDVLMLSMADAAYRPGSLYATFTEDHIFIFALAMLLTGVLLLGMLGRERLGPWKIGSESVLVLLLYALGMTVLVL